MAFSLLGLHAPLARAVRAPVIDAGTVCCSRPCLGSGKHGTRIAALDPRGREGEDSKRRRALRTETRSGRALPAVRGSGVPGVAGVVQW